MAEEVNSGEIDRFIEVSTNGDGPSQGMRFLGAVPLHLLHGNPRNRPVLPASAKQMAESLRTVGLLHPVVVEPFLSGQDGPPWLLVAGHRRLEGARLLGWESLDCVILPSGDSELRAAAENASREGLTPAQQSDQVWNLNKRYSWKEIAATMGMSASHVMNLGRIKYKLHEEAWSVFEAQGHGAKLRDWIAISNRPKSVQLSLLKTGNAPSKKEQSPKPRWIHIVRQRQALDPKDMRAKVLDWVLGHGEWPTHLA